VKLGQLDELNIASGDRQIGFTGYRFSQSHRLKVPPRQYYLAY